MGRRLGIDVSLFFFEFSDQVGGRHLAEVALKRSLPVRGVVPGPRDGVWGRGYFKKLQNRDATLDTAHASSEGWGIFRYPCHLGS